MKTSVLVFILLMTGCYTPRQIRNICATCPIVNNDSTWYNRYTTYKDSVIGTPPDSAKIIYLVHPCPDGSLAKIESVESKHGRYTNIRSKINKSTKGNEIVVNVDSKPLNAIVKIPTTTIEKGRSVEKTLPCPEHTHFWYIFGISSMSVLAFLGWIMFGIEKMRR